MKLLYLGTGAAEGIPALFCECDVCKKARAAGGKEIRTRAGALLDGVLKLDFGPDSYIQMINNKLDFTYLKSVLITHTHEDHFSYADLRLRRRGFANLKDTTETLTVYGNAQTEPLLDLNQNCYLDFKRVKTFESFEVEGYIVTPLEAVHCAGGDSAFPVKLGMKTVYRMEEAFIYLIEKDGKALLYAHDTDMLTPDDFRYLAGKHLDLVSLDCTKGAAAKGYIGHMAAEDNLLIRERFIAEGIADEKTVFVANHFSHNGYTDFADMEKCMPGFVIAYDGLEIEF